MPENKIYVDTRERSGVPDILQEMEIPTEAILILRSNSQLISFLKIMKIRYIYTHDLNLLFQMLDSKAIGALTGVGQ